MKITKVESLLVDPFSERRRVDGYGTPDAWNPILVKIYTDEGITGVGEAGVAYGCGGTAAWGMVRDLGRHIIGMDPLDTEKIWHRFMHKTFWGQGGGIVFFAGVSAIDIALWDIKGKYYNVPVYKLLGGKVNSELRCYASQIQFGWKNSDDISTTSAITPDDYAGAATRAIEQGYDALKVDLFEINEAGEMKVDDLTGHLTNKVIDNGIARLEAIRNAVGYDVDIIVENHGETDTSTAVQVSKAIEPYRIMYLEEPNMPLNAMLTGDIKERTNIPIAHGERLFTRWGFAPFITNRYIELAQPDLGICGGLTEAKKIADFAHVYDIRIQAHVCGSPVGEAAALHLETAIPNFGIHEYHQCSMEPRNQELVTHFYTPENGILKAPELPGIGTDITPEAYKRAKVLVVDD